jgi:hypothetical protein
VKIITSNDDQNDLLQSIHAGLGKTVAGKSTGGHFGINKTLDKLSQRFFWEGLTNDVKKFVSTCHRCQMVNSIALQKGNAQLHSIPVPVKPWSQIGIDLMELKITDEGYKYVCTAICYMTKYVEMKALKQKTAANVAIFLFELMCRYGCSDVHITDQGTEFCNLLQDEMYELSGTRHRVTSAYHPQANGLVECQNCTTSDQIRKAMEEQEDWYNMLPSICFAHRSSKHASTGFTPMELMFGRKPVLPAELMHRELEDLESDISLEAASAFENITFDDRIDAIEKIRKPIMEAAKANIDKAQARQKKNYDLKHIGVYSFKVGDLVVKDLPRNKSRKGGKLDPKFMGPYKIHEVQDNGNFRLMNESTGRVLEKVTPGVQIKRYLVANAQNVQPPKDDADNDADEPNSQASESTQPSQNTQPSPSQNTQPSQNTPPPPQKPNAKETDIPCSTAEPQAKRPRVSDDSTDGPSPDNSGIPCSTDQPEAKRAKVSDDSTDGPPCSTAADRYDETGVIGESPAVPIHFNPLSQNFCTRICKAHGFKVSKSRPKYHNVGAICTGEPSSVVRMAPDGNCFFRSIAYILCGDQDQHATVRAVITKFIAENSTKLVKFLTHKGKAFTKGDEYLSATGMENDRTWGTDCEIMATAYITKRDVVVFIGGKWLRYGSGSKPTASALYIDNRFSHFNAVEGVK